MVDIGHLAVGGWHAAADRCPKKMDYGPCAGVGTDGSCEVPGFGACSFVQVDAADWPYAATLAAGPLAAARPEPPAAGRQPAVAAFLAAAGSRPVVVADLPAEPLSAASLRASAAALAGVADACLLGDHGGARVQFPPSYRARLLAEEGVPAWVGINCRDRNRVAIEGEIAACVDAGAVGVHCVTGDHSALGHRPEARAVFDLDSVGVVRRVAAAAARSGGALCSVAHAPAAPPTDRRLPRLLTKIDAGADVVFVDHCGGPGPVAEAVAELRAAGFAGLVLVCVPVVTSTASAAVIASFATGRLPDGYLERITGTWAARAFTTANATPAVPTPNGTPPGRGASGTPAADRTADGAPADRAADPAPADRGADGGPADRAANGAWPTIPAAEAAEIEAAGIAEGTELAERMLEIPGVDGVNLSGGAPPGQEAALAAAMAEITRRVLGVAPARSRRQARHPVGASRTAVGPA
ncbi:methylenetetrahydrofolate reductase [Frankia nepalensis]|uniref:methylenetetrahydrofolate reductase n=1 Tax=Frankia nepalensis TaxID=1836974 RepID=UPI0027DBFFED|nr:methylenetetrahydrofolate reductase [Frankia nepalensis]